jgi:hypothetical protein
MTATGRAFAFIFVMSCPVAAILPVHGRNIQGSGGQGRFFTIPRLSNSEAKRPFCPRLRELGLRELGRREQGRHEPAGAR